MTTLTDALMGLCQKLQDCFPQQRTLDRATSLLLAGLLCGGRKWVTRLNCVRNREQVDWSGDYRVFSRSPWTAADLFVPAIEASLPFSGTGPIRLAMKHGPGEEGKKSSAAVGPATRFLRLSTPTS